MNKTEVLDLLKTVTFPGYSRDIVSFGMVQDVVIEENSVTVMLKISTSQDEKRQAVKKDVRTRLESTTGFTRVNVELLEDKHTEPSSPAAKTQRPTIRGNVKNIIAIASGKGGVGKSTVAVNIAATLTARNYQVGLLDLDIYGPSLPIILGINKQPKINRERNLVPLDRYGMKVMSFGFLSGNETPVIWRGPLVARMTEQFFADVEWGELDYLVLDLPPGTGDVQLTLTQKINISGAIIVTTPQDIALNDVLKGAEMFRKVDAHVLGVIENMSGLQLDGQVVDREDNAVPDVAIKFDGIDPVRVGAKGQFSFRLDLFKRGGGLKVSGLLEVPLLGEIPISQEIMAATDAGMPIVLTKPESSISHVFRGIVDKLEQYL